MSRTRVKLKDNDNEKLQDELYRYREELAQNQKKLESALKKEKALEHRVKLERYTRTKEQKKYHNEKDSLKNEIETLKQQIEQLAIEAKEKNRTADHPEVISDVKKETAPSLPFVPLAPLQNNLPESSVSSSTSDEQNITDVAEPSDHDKAAKSAYSRLSLWYWMGYNKSKTSPANSQNSDSLSEKTSEADSLQIETSHQAEPSQSDLTPKPR